MVFVLSHRRRWSIRDIAFRVNGISSSRGGRKDHGAKVQARKTWRFAQNAIKSRKIYRFYDRDYTAATRPLHCECVENAVNWLLYRSAHCLSVGTNQDDDDDDGDGRWSWIELGTFLASRSGLSFDFRAGEDTRAACASCANRIIYESVEAI